MRYGDMYISLPDRFKKTGSLRLIAHDFKKPKPICIHNNNNKNLCGREMAVRYAALSACRKVRMPSARAEKYICVIVIR